MTPLRKRPRRALMLGLRLMLGGTAFAVCAPAFAPTAAHADGRGWDRGGDRGGWDHRGWEHRRWEHGRWNYYGYGAPAVVVAPPVMVAPPPVVVAPPPVMVAPPPVVMMPPAGINVFIPFHLW